MSRIGKKPIPVPEKVKVNVEGTTVTVEGPRGKLQYTFHPDAIIELDEVNKQIIVKRKSDAKFHRALHGTVRAIIANMVRGVVDGFSKTLLLRGLGYRARLEGKTLVLQVGFSHDVKVEVPDDLQVEVKEPTRNDPDYKIIVSGIDKQKVGQFAALIRSVRPVEPYKLKGFRYADEFVIRKAGKAGAKK